MNYFKTAILLVCLTLILVWIGELIGGVQGAWTAFIFALVINGVSYWFSDKIVLAMYRAKPLPENQFGNVYRIVRGLAVQAGLPMPRLYIIDQASPNAFATGRDYNHACLCVTKGILEILTEDELKGVLAHELAHVKNRDTLIMTVAAAIAGAVMMIANMARWAAIFGGGNSGRDRRDSGNAIALLAVSIIAPLAALIVQLAISRSREYGADNTGAHIAKDNNGLMSALVKLDSASKRYRLEASPQTAHLFIVNPFSGDFIASLFSTHPPIKDRVAKLKAIKL